MRSYKQYCGLAKALDVVGDRWTLLIVRELLLRGPSRYTELRDGLPGIATNLLADRLRELERTGLLMRTEPTPPLATALFSLTSWGEELRPVVLALGLWAGRLMQKPARGDRFQTHWLAMPLEAYLEDGAPGEPPVHVELRTKSGTVVLTADHEIRVRAGSAAHPDAVVSGSPELIIAVLLRRTSIATARSRGLLVDGNTEALRRLLPSSGRTTAEG